MGAMPAGGRVMTKEVVLACHAAGRMPPAEEEYNDEVGERLVNEEYKVWGLISGCSTWLR